MSREWDLNPRPADYESAALPLSYLGLIRKSLLSGQFLTIEIISQTTDIQKVKLFVKSINWHMLSKKCKYAIHALIYLAERYQEGPVHIQEIAEKRNIPKKFLEAILLELRKAKILHSKKGKGGGYYLYQKPTEVNLMEIMRLMDGPIAMLPCVSLHYYERCEECRSEKTCGIRDVFIKVRDETLEILGGSTLDKILKREKAMATK